jgi:hypothetical protein
VEDEVGPGALWGVVIGVVGDGIRWSGFHNLMCELEAPVRVVE